MSLNKKKDNYVNKKKQVKKYFGGKISTWRYFHYKTNLILGRYEVNLTNLIYRVVAILTIIMTRVEGKLFHFKDCKINIKNVHVYKYISKAKNARNFN